MNTLMWVLILVVDDGTGTIRHREVYSQYLTRVECIAQRDSINSNVPRARAECYELRITKEK